MQDKTKNQNRVPEPPKQFRREAPPAPRRGDYRSQTEYERDYDRWAAMWGGGMK